MKLLSHKHRDDHDRARQLQAEIATVVQVMESYPEPVSLSLSFGAPTRCPDCTEWGLIDEVDAGATTNHCYLCGAEWTITLRALGAIATENARLAAAERDLPVGEGILYDTAMPPAVTPLFGWDFGVRVAERTADKRAERALSDSASRHPSSGRPLPGRPSLARLSPTRLRVVGH